MFERILGRLEQTRVRVHRRRRENGEEERERKKENDLNRAKSFYIGALDRVGSDPIQLPTPLAIRSRYRGIRINPTPLRHPEDPDPPSCVGLGFVTVGVCFLLIFLEFFCYAHLCSYYLNPCAR